MNLAKVSVVSLTLAGILSAEGILEQVERERGEVEAVKQEEAQKAKMQEETKSGFFLGLEIGVGNTSITQSGYSLVGSPINSFKSNASFDIGLSLGYQHYFDEKEKHGMRASLGIGSGVPPIGEKVEENTAFNSISFRNDFVQ